MAPRLRVSVVLPSYRRIERLPELIRTYRRLGADEVVVVLDGPHPGWQSALAEFTALDDVVIDELSPNRGLALARIEGLMRSSGDVVVLADDDVVPADGHIARHRAYHSANPDSALLGWMPVALPDRRGADQAPTFLYAQDYANQVEIWRTADSATLLASFWGGNASVPRQAYLEAEALKPSETLHYNEDLDLGLRLLANGLSAAFDPHAAAQHHHQRGLDPFLAECVRRGEAVRELERRWPGLPHQISELVEIPVDHHPLVAAMQRRIGERDGRGLLEWTLVLGYRVSGRLRVWRLQDAITRLLRRGLAIRGYRLAETATVDSHAAAGVAGSRRAA